MPVYAGQKSVMWKKEVQTGNRFGAALGIAAGLALLGLGVYKFWLSRPKVAFTDGKARSRGVTEDPTPVVDESTLSDEDKAAVEEFRARVSKATGRGKRGGLGWQEITVDGRSGLQARWGKGQFKILHTGGDSHALFYEWDGGKWERIACGKADDLMRLAAARSEDEQPKAPLTTLTLEVARLFCGTPDQQEAASERLRPVRTPVEPEPAARAPRKAKADRPAEDAPRPPAGETPSETEVMDKELMSSFASELESMLAEGD